ncbi:MAG: sigma-70 family RNA polymerase sigma factor [Candidatus Omnitrophica bacterium]|nr:sigma-70 family RNA polymerase sigma factor [Candidatus Omnitrophota bacterium]
MSGLVVLDSDLDADELVQVQDEPALEIALPQVFIQPTLTTLQRGKLPHVEWLVARLYQRAGDRAGTVLAGEEVPRAAERAALGPDYQALINEFQPLFTWGMACWDFLLSTEGCRFLPRHPGDKVCYRGDYRVVTDVDYSRLLHRVFRQCVLACARTSIEQSLTGYVRVHFWNAVLSAYRELENPPDPCQRTLTAYSYLRCTPYQFLNAYHHELVHRTLHALPPQERRILDAYFLHFLKLEAAAQAASLPVEQTGAALRRGLVTLLLEHRLVYCLLRQIERY